MFKGLIFSLLLIFSTVASAYEYAFKIEQVGNDLVLSIEGTDVASIDKYGLKSKEEQKRILDGALKVVDFCTAKGKWGSSVADEAKHKINSVEYHINHLKKITEGEKIPPHMIVDSERVIREAYRSGHKDPISFGKLVILQCLRSGF